MRDVRYGLAETAQNVLQYIWQKLLKCSSPHIKYSLLELIATLRYFERFLPGLACFSRWADLLTGVWALAMAAMWSAPDAGAPDSAAFALTLARAPAVALAPALMNMLLRTASYG
jgi:hypothetical protein